MHQLRISRRFEAHASKEKGISLIEALVSLVILALGVLGLLGLQMRNMVDNQSASSRVAAARFAEELFEKVRANPANTLNAANPLAAGQWNWLSSYALTWGSSPTASTNCSTTFCTGAQKALWDLDNWSKAVSAGIPGGSAFVTNNARQLVVIIGWRANEGKEAVDNTGYTSPFAVSIPGVTTPTACGTTHICYAAYGQP